MRSPGHWPTALQLIESLRVSLGQRMAAGPSQAKKLHLQGREKMGMLLSSHVKGDILEGIID